MSRRHKAVRETTRQRFRGRRAYRRLGKTKAERRVALLEMLQSWAARHRDAVMTEQLS